MVGSGASRGSLGSNPSFATYCIQAGQPWVGHSTSLGLRFLTCKMGDNNGTHRVAVGLKELIPVKHLETISGT